MGINRIRLQNGAMGDPRVDARMQQTYQQNIADNQAQRARNEGILQAARAAMLSAQPKNLTGATTKLYSGTTSATPFGGSKFFATPDLATAKTYATSSPLRGSPLAGPVTGKILQAEVPTSQAQNLLKKGLTGTREVVLDPQAAKTLFETGQGTLKGAGSLATKAAVAGTKALPFVGGAVSLADAALRAKEGDYVGAGLGAAGAVPVLGLPALGAQVIYDQFIKKDSKEPEAATPTPDAGTNLTQYSNIPELTRLIDDNPNINNLAEADDYLKMQAGVVPGFTRLKNPNSAPGNYDEFMYRGPDGDIYGSQTYSRMAASGSYKDLFKDYYAQNEMMASGGRVGFQDGSPEEMAKAQEAAAFDPALDVIRQQLIGEDYKQDIGSGQGIAQYYSGFGLPQSLQFTPPVEEVTPVVDVTQPVVDTGGGGGGQELSTSGVDTILDTGDAPINLDTPLTQMITTPTGDTMTVKEAMTGTPQVYGIPGEMPKTPVSGAFGPFDYLQPETSDPFLMSGAAGGARLPQIGYGEGEVDPNLAAAVGLKDTTSLGGANLVTTSSGDVFASDDPMLSEKIDFQTPEQTNAINEVFNNVKDLGEAGVGKLRDSLVALGGKVKEGFDNTIEIGGKTIDLTKSLIGGAISLATGIPGVGFALNTMQEDKYNKEAQGALGEIDMLKTTEGGLTQDKYGINIQSAFGDYDDYNLERQIDLQEKIDDGAIQEFKEDGSLTYFGQELKDRKEIEQKLNETRLEEARQEQQDFVQEMEAQPVVQAGSKAAKEQQDNTGVANVSTGIGGLGSGGYQTSSGDVYASAAEAAEKGDGGGSSGGKGIVCTMMNDFYGFGSFRNKIWLEHSKSLAPEYQKGYHKIFLPLVAYARKDGVTNKIVRKTLEHIAVHRTIDIRQEARGKVHLLGRIYRKVLEPICYWVGKYAKK